MKRSAIYWLTSSLSETHQRRAGILDDIGYQTYFFDNLETLIKEISIKRAKILILGDEWPSEVLERHIHTFANIPDINSARLLLSNSSNSFSAMRAASLEGFRDIIPFDLDDGEWLQRFEFATSGLESILDLHDDLKKINETIELSIPARIVWIGAQTLWIETRAVAQVGEIVTLRGHLAEQLGLEQINAVVTEKQSTSLSFRFSEALVLNWIQDASARAKPEALQAVIQKLREQDLGLRPKIFLAIQSPALRTTILRYVDRKKYEVHTALQKSSLVYEPRFFTPDLVFIEETLTNGEGRQAFFEMLRYLPEHACIVTIGGRNEGTEIKTSTSGRRMRSLRHIPLNLGELVEKDYLTGFHQKPADKERRMAFLPHESPFSYAAVAVEAKLISADHLQFDLSSPRQITTYSLMYARGKRLDELLGGPSFLKVVSGQRGSQDVGEGPYPFIAHLCNLVEPIREALGKRSRSPKVKTK